VAFGDAGQAEQKWDALASVLAWSRTHDVTPVSVDVRVPTSPAVRTSDAQASTPGG
jgi:hypothetical protein